MLRPRTLAAIERARAAGLRVIVATGPDVPLRAALPRRGGHRRPGRLLPGRGRRRPASRGAFLRHEPIPLELAREAIAALEEERFHVNCYVDDELYVAEVTPEAERYASFQSLPIHPVGDLLAWLAEPPTKLVTIGEPDALDGLEARMKARFDGRLYISKSLPFFLEFASPEVTKASGLAFLAEHLGFGPSARSPSATGRTTSSCSSGPAYGVAVANAHERVLAVADFVCPPASEEGVAQVIEAYLESRP